MKLLIVDDDQSLCEMLEAHFGDECACDILVARNAQEALERLEHERPEGMLLDVNLGKGLTGFDVLERARRISPETKVIMITGSNDYESIENARKLGAVDYVTKPFTFEYLEETVAAKIAKHVTQV
jgi:DNA-binding NtrC family response regulator